MPTDSNGVYTLPAGYLAITGETILASQHNPPLEDIATALTNRLSRNGSAPMTGALKLADGTAGSPGLTFNSAATAGLYKTTSGVGMSVSGTLVQEWLASTTVFYNGVVFSDKGDTASANALTLGTGNIFNITGTTTINTIGTKGIGSIVWFRFNASLQLTHDATNLVLLTGANIQTRAGDMAQFEEYGTGTWRMIAYHRADGSPLVAATSRGYIDGFTLSQASTTSLGISSGVCRDDSNGFDITLGSAYTKTTASWSVGSGNGGLDTGAISSNTWYYAYAILRTDTNVKDVLFTTTFGSPTMPTNYTKKRYIGAFKTNGSSQIPVIIQYGDEFYFSSMATSAANPAAASTSVSLVTLNVPTGFKVKAFVRVNATSAVFVRVYDPARADDTAGITNSNVPSATQGGLIEVWTNTSGQVKHTESSATGNIYLGTEGYMDRRGKDA